LIAWFHGAGITWLVAGLLLGAVVQFTLVVIAPTNKRLEDRDLDLSGDLARHLLRRAGKLRRMIDHS